MYVYYIYLNFVLLATRPEVTVEAVINVDMNLKEISQHRETLLSASMKRKMFTASKAVIGIEQDLFLKTKYERLFIIDTAPNEIIEHLRSLSTVNLRTKNFTRNSAIVDEIRRAAVPFVDKLIYSKSQSSNRVITSPNNGTLLMARLVPQQSIVEESKVNVPVSKVLVTITHLRNCMYLPHNCAGYKVEW